MDVNIENIKTQMRKGFLDYCILLILKKEATYAPDIIKTLKDSNLIVVEGTLYPLLTRLKNNGILEYTWQESRQGPPRKYYSLTPKGEEMLQELDKEGLELAEIVNHLRNDN